MNIIDELVTHQSNNIIHCPEFVNLKNENKLFYRHSRIVFLPNPPTANL